MARPRLLKKLRPQTCFLSESYLETVVFPREGQVDAVMNTPVEDSATLSPLRQRDFVSFLELQNNAGGLRSTVCVTRELADALQTYLVEAGRKRVFCVGLGQMAWADALEYEYSDEVEGHDVKLQVVGRKSYSPLQEEVDDDVDDEDDDATNEDAPPDADDPDGSKNKLLKNLRRLRPD